MWISYKIFCETCVTQSGSMNVSGRNGNLRELPISSPFSNHREGYFSKGLFPCKNMLSSFYSTCHAKRKPITLSDNMFLKKQTNRCGKLETKPWNCIVLISNLQWGLYKFLLLRDKALTHGREEIMMTNTSYSLSRRFLHNDFHTKVKYSIVTFLPT